ncbi:MAG: ammonium transporter [Candidatus Omnitrophota bacterium]|nr:ammonium transporter [Candidatus Omnitrophota bacterium]
MDAKVALDTIWTLVTAMLVFWMNAGFATVEAGFQPQKNCVNILSKNFVVFAIASLAYWWIGFGLQFGDGNGWFGLQGLLMLHGADNSPAAGEAYKGVYSALSWTGVPLMAKFFFQLVFAGTAATIVSGAVGGRIKYFSFLVFSFFLCGLVYPVVGHWIWGGGWLAKAGFWDFAGSTVVHSVGGWGALAGALILGPRFGKYRQDGSITPTPGHNLGMATIGTFILWLGWFGFNPGSTMAADPGAIARICVTTNSAAIAGILAATFTSCFTMGKPDLGMTLNGCLAGLVAVTAPCAFVSVESSLIIGAVAGVLVVLAVPLFDRLRIDDPVGATSVHLVNGIWGTLAVGLFAQDLFMPNTTGNGLFFGGGTKLLAAQATGVFGVGVFSFIAFAVLWALLKVTMGIRVSLQEELGGLDAGEHGNSAYPEFVIRKPAYSFTTVSALPSETPEAVNGGSKR